MTSRSSTASAILAVLAIALVMSWAYLGGYYALGEYDELTTTVCLKAFGETISTSGWRISTGLRAKWKRGCAASA